MKFSDDLRSPPIGQGNTIRGSCDYNVTNMVWESKLTTLYRNFAVASKIKAMGCNDNNFRTRSLNIASRDPRASLPTEKDEIWNIVHLSGAIDKFPVVLVTCANAHAQ